LALAVTSDRGLLPREAAVALSTERVRRCMGTRRWSIF
jgi:hypothetical protein